MHGGTVDFKGCITHGPWGASDGEEWVYKPENFIRKIIVNYRAVVIDSIRFQTGEIESSWFGVPCSSGESDTISINYPLEYLVSISGTFGSFDEYDDVVKSLCFKTNVTSYGPYGTNSGTAFSYDSKGGMILGFHGRAHQYLTAIAFIMAMPREVGPWGAGGGKPWDDGASQLSNKYVNLDENDEFLTGVSGFYGPVKRYNGLEAIRSISFHTNKRIHGPYGEERGAGHVYYSSTASPGKIVGFHGRDIGFLSAIGVHMEYF
ncbi:putative jacalin-like lectin domain-containing protein [Helianthus annuus]|uniref:Jacalin-like lectin domain-containing protein n=1 Tax=Helianthus annuus TaxID=4232 RepID=A0A9K3NZ28_HELAN|nr:putative jacalin-like lectin domain-containing protein [Helianthus annuus]